MNLKTRYLGLDLQNPLVASASPLSRTLNGIRRLEDAGAGAIVLYSLFAEQVVWSDTPMSLQPHLAPPGGPPNWDTEPIGPDEYLDLISLAKRATSVPLIGSLNGSASGDWIRYAGLMQGAGADALELNLNYVPTDPTLSAADVERQYLDAVRDVRASMTLPLAVKIGPYFSALPAMVGQLSEAGADALVLFNPFYAPDFDIENRSTNLHHLALSTPSDVLLRLRWIALLYKNVDAELALTGGVHSHIEVVKGLMAGASVVMMTAELMQNGPKRLGEIVDALSKWLDSHGFASIDAVRGVLSVHQGDTEQAGSERTGYINTIRPLPLDGIPVQSPW